MFTSFRRSISVMLATACLALAAACSSMSTAPPAGVVADIEAACATDQVLRPVVDGLAAFATPADKAGLGAAHAVIDPVCANPTASVDANAAAAVTDALGQVTSIATALNQRKQRSTPTTPGPAGPVPSVPAAASAKASA